MKRPLCSLVVFGVLAPMLTSGCGGGGDGSGGPPPPHVADTTPPTVLSTSPADHQTDQAVTSVVRATFSEAMDPSTVNTSTFTLKYGGNDPVGGTVGYTGTTATFSPDAELAYSTTYTATITTGAKDLAGNPVAHDHSWTFTTGVAPDTTPPTAATAPANGEMDVAVSTSITATFSEAMDPTAIDTSSFTVKDGRNNPVDGTVTYSGTTATFRPAVALAHATAYVATISRTVKDLAGNPLESDKIWSFTTATTVFAVELAPPPSSVYTFDTSAPNDPTLIGSGTLVSFNYALGFDASGSTLYAMDTVSELGTIDVSTGAYTLLGSVSGILSNHNVLGLATDPTTGTIYIVSSNGFSGSSALYTLNPGALSATLVGSQSAAKYLVELASDLAGTLYTVSLDTDSLYTVDKLNGQVTLVGEIGQDIIGQQGMAFDQATGRLYGIIGNRDLANYAFGTIDMATGAFTASVAVDDVRKIAIAPVP